MMAATLVRVSEARRFMVDCLMAVGTRKDYADAMADVLVSADYRGHYSHGMNRLEMYIDDIKEKRLMPNASPSIIKETASTAWVDGQNGLGAVVGNFCMQLAISKARETGIGWVVAKGSNHYGIAAHYSMQALKAGMVGMSFTNTSPIMSPTRAKEAALGTNPLSVAAPGLNNDSIVLDMATTAVAVGKIEIQRRKGEPIPEGWAQGPDGNLTTDADVAMNTSCLMPLGGSEITSGYKGYGLALMVEMFCGLMSGSAYGPNVRRWMSPGSDPANLGQCFVAIDPSSFAPGFEERTSDIGSHLRSMTPTKEGLPVLVPGDPEKAHMKLVDDEGGVKYVENQIKTAHALANQLQVKALTAK